MKNLFIIILAIFFAGIFYSCNEEYPSIDDVEVEEEIDLNKIKAHILNLHQDWNEAMDNEDYYTLKKICTSEEWIQAYILSFKNSWDEGGERKVIFYGMFIEEINLEDNFIILYGYATVTRYDGFVSNMKITTGLALDGEDIYNDWKFYGMAMKDW